jgi:hypothetical protein
VEEWEYDSPEVINELVEITGRWGRRFMAINTDIWEAFAPEEELQQEIEDFNQLFVPDWGDTKGFGYGPGAFVFSLDNPDWKGLEDTMRDWGFEQGSEYNGANIWTSGNVFEGLGASPRRVNLMMDYRGENHNLFFTGISTFGDTEDVIRGFEDYVDAINGDGPGFDEEGQPLYSLAESDQYVLSNENSVGFMMHPDDEHLPDEFMSYEIMRSGSNYPVTMHIREDGQGVILRQLRVGDESVELEEEKVYDDFGPMANTTDLIGDLPGFVYWTDAYSEE